MKFKVGDQVLVTAGKDKGVKGKIIQVLPQLQQVVVADVNVYTKNIKPIGDRPGDRVRKERPLSTAKIAILNDQGQADRIGYQVAKDGTKKRIFKKTGQAVPKPKAETKSQTKK